MGRLNTTIDHFYLLLRAGLWERDVCMQQFFAVDYKEILNLSEAQSVAGLISAGLEPVVEAKVPK